MLKICKILVLFLIALPATAHAQSVLGTLPLDRGDKLWYMQVNMPDAEIGMMQGLSSLADVAPHVRVQYFPSGRLAKFGLVLALACVCAWRNFPAGMWRSIPIPNCFSPLFHRAVTIRLTRATFLAFALACRA